MGQFGERQESMIRESIHIPCWSKVLLYYAREFARPFSTQPPRIVPVMLNLFVGNVVPEFVFQRLPAIWRHRISALLVILNRSAGNLHKFACLACVETGAVASRLNFACLVSRI